MRSGSARGSACACPPFNVSFRARPALCSLDSSATVDGLLSADATDGHSHLQLALFHPACPSSPSPQPMQQLQPDRGSSSPLSASNKPIITSRVCSDCPRSAISSAPPKDSRGQRRARQKQKSKKKCLRNFKTPSGPGRDGGNYRLINKAFNYLNSFYSRCHK